MIARNEANSIPNPGWFNEGRLLLVGSNPVPFLVGLLLYLMMHSLIAWLNEAVDHSPVLNRPGLPSWTQLTYFLSVLTSSVFLLHFAMNKIFYFAQCPKRQRGINNVEMTLVFYFFHTDKRTANSEIENVFFEEKTKFSVFSSSFLVIFNISKWN